ncbi:MAG: 30S ribosomal protein S2 [Bdellovibrionales bacterium]|nr:30S ribosomal protein S2 [Bdellovibrionales bacterium]
MSITIQSLLDAGAHFGHQTHRWNPKMKPYIHGARNGIYIINLEKTLSQWNKTRKVVVDKISKGGKIIFVGTKPQAQEIIQEECERAKQFYVNRRWLGGMLTNFETIKKRIDRLNEIEEILGTDKIKEHSKKDILFITKEKQRLEKSLSGIKSMDKVPSLMVVIDPNKEHIAVKEAQKLGIPIISIVDTNCNPDGIDYVIPANDDALKSIRLFLSEIANACLEGAQEYEVYVQEQSKKRLQAEAERKKLAEQQAQSKTDESIKEVAEEENKKDKGPVVEKKVTKKAEAANAQASNTSSN